MIPRNWAGVTPKLPQKIKRDNFTSILFCLFGNGKPVYVGQLHRFPLAREGVFRIFFGL